MGTIVGGPLYRTESRSGGSILIQENIVSAQHHGNTGRLVSGVTSLPGWSDTGGDCVSGVLTADAIAPTGGHSAAGDSVIKPGYDPALTNGDLAPLRTQTWTSYNFFAFWMSDVHSVGGYVFAGSLFALGISASQVLLALLVGIVAVYWLCNLVARPSQQTGVPYPVTARIAFGVRGANLPAVIRGLIAVAWYGIQTYLASTAFVLLSVKFQPSLGRYGNAGEYGFLGLSLLGWGGFLLMWVLQAAVFWNGMEAIRKFIDFCGPAVYAVMLALALYLVVAAGWENVHFGLASGPPKSGFAAFATILSAIALVVSYFSGPMLNFGDFSRYGRTFGEVKRGNFLGLPLNFLFFAVLAVCTVSAGATVIGRGEDGAIITDPVLIVDKIDNTTAAVLGVLTFAIATIGINIVANFVSPAFDFSNLAPTRISWRTGGMIAAVGSILITPWNLYNNPNTIHYTLDALGAVIGPLFGILIADFYLVRRRAVVVDDLFTLSPSGTYQYRGGINPIAVTATVVGALLAIATVIWGSPYLATFTWFVGAGIGFAVYLVGMRYTPRHLIYGR
ncbi:NCS1 family nucleobase:cation symporter-1 [Mycobacteroides abscessus]|uniref:NCS1 family nucleobase:cation symporter-1 n=1 Tax=Mycobacteroides abscessus TaxID=36809 RepID=UPI00092CD8B5|nr:NCS1 family nucleobase:cation symporter-1 [Mycobacteroides abscessus]MDO3333508.1 NCS1 family nucleobase:cation symporter-1 [Mycobacteroides abscessus subsp. bolletii]QSM87233.1 NCS1 family nucleobase:cation symporter-1 [Mycobacteroides abscessus subsp. bolletii]SIB75495.1 allantoin permease [Mycobacteroides abscessus subsp. bolletii]SIJ31917.1 allantoin permease [Mycobacteroides abscessus subsp. bolletii]SKS97639.1 allantoin permease [Mycobacteroides abscessus subsp. bolletii]